MAFGVHAIKGVAYHPLLVDDEGGTGHPFPHDAIHFPVGQHPVGPAGNTFLIRQQTHADAMLVPEHAMADAVVPGNAKYHRVQAGEIHLQVAELDRFSGTA
jgi:hypothetical protein